MTLEKIGSFINFFVELLEILATGRLTQAILKIRHSKEIQTTGKTDSVATDGQQTKDKIKPHFAGLGPEDNILRESILSIIHPNRQKIYRKFESWLLKNHIFDWAPLMHYLTTQAEKDPQGAQRTYEEIIDIVKNTNNNEGLKFVQELTNKIIVKIIKAHWANFLKIKDEFLKNHPRMKRDLVKNINKLDRWVGSHLDLQDYMTKRKAGQKKFKIFSYILWGAGIISFAALCYMLS